MKKFQHVGRSLTESEQRNLMGGFVPEDGGSCTYTYNGMAGNTCDYIMTCTNNEGATSTRLFCDTTCMPGCTTWGSSCTVSW